MELSSKFYFVLCDGFDFKHDESTKASEGSVSQCQSLKALMTKRKYSKEAEIYPPICFMHMPEKDFHCKVVSSKAHCNGSIHNLLLQLATIELKRNLEVLNML